MEKGSPEWIKMMTEHGKKGARFGVQGAKHGKKGGRPSKSTAEERVGQVFGKLKVIHYENATKVHVECECGKWKVVHWSSLQNGLTRSCGCLRDEKLRSRTKKHGMSQTPVHNVWTAMKQRCTNPSSPNWKNYGGRGIKVCKRWMKFENFLKDMGEPPEGMSIDRVNNDGDYEPSNCRWSTRKQQNNNTRSNQRITFQGRTQTLTQWAEEYGLGRQQLYWRIKRGWTIEKALQTPISENNKGSNHGMSKLSEEQVKWIWILYHQMKQPTAKLAQEFAVHKVTIVDVVMGRTWASVTSLLQK